tara:strand:- start:1625 stop:1897 length:273 start_codon:yes stop_codon:yes gene_type:complete
MPILIAEQACCDDITLRACPPFTVCKQVLTSALKVFRAGQRNAVMQSVTLNTFLPHWFFAVIAQAFLMKKCDRPGSFEGRSILLGHDVST